MKKLGFISILLVIVFSSYSQSNKSSLAKNSGEILWYHSFKGMATETSDPVLTLEENIILIKYASAGIPESEIICFDPSGEIIWSKQYDISFELAPMIVPELGWILVCSENDLLCLNSDGSQRWSVSAPEIISQSPVMDSDFNIYIPYLDYLLSYDSSGVFRWEFYSSSGYVDTPLAISNDNIYYGTDADKLVAVDKTGTKIFTHGLFGYVREAPSIDNNGIIYMTTSDITVNQSKIEAFDPYGNMLWDMTLDEPNPSAVIIGDSNYIYTRTMRFWGGRYGKLYKINKLEQSIVWDFYYGPNVSGASDPSLSEQGNIFITVGQDFPRYYSIDKDGNITWELDPSAATGKDLSPRNHMLIGKNGNIYTLAWESYDSIHLIAIKDSNAIIANTAWPMHKHDQHYSSRTISYDTSWLNTDEKTNYLGGIKDLAIIPNPVNENINIQWTLNHGSETKIMIYNSLGKEMNSYVRNGIKGVNHFSWEGKKLNPGVYLVNVSTKEQISSIKMIKK